jgi:hypothetical protein
VKAFTVAAPGPCDTAVVSQAEILKPQNPLMASVPQRLRANDNGALPRQSESA